MQVAIPGKRCVAPHAVNRDTGKCSTQVVELWQNFVEDGQLVATNRAPVSRVKCEHHGLAAKLMQAH